MKAKEYSNRKFGQVGADICAHFSPIDDIAAESGVPAHGTGAVALVVVVRTLLGRQGQATDGALENG